MLDSIAQPLFILSRAAAIAGILALTLIFDVPNCVLQVRRLQRGHGSSAVMAMPAFAYMIVMLYCRTPVVLGPVHGIFANVAGRMLDPVAACVWHVTFVVVLPLGPVRLLKKAHGG